SGLAACQERRSHACHTGGRGFAASRGSFRNIFFGKYTWEMTGFCELESTAGKNMFHQIAARSWHATIPTVRMVQRSTIPMTRVVATYNYSIIACALPIIPLLAITIIFLAIILRRFLKDTRFLMPL